MTSSSGRPTHINPREVGHGKELQRRQIILVKTSILLLYSLLNGFTLFHRSNYPVKLALLCHLAGDEVKWGEVMRLAKATLGGEAGCPSGL